MSIGRRDSNLSSLSTVISVIIQGLVNIPYEITNSQILSGGK